MSVPSFPSTTHPGLKFHTTRKELEKILIKSRKYNINLRGLLVRQTCDCLWRVILIAGLLEQEDRSQYNTMKKILSSRNVCYKKIFWVVVADIAAPGQFAWSWQILGREVKDLEFGIDESGRVAIVANNREEARIIRDILHG